MPNLALPATGPVHHKSDVIAARRFDGPHRIHDGQTDCELGPFAGDARYRDDTFHLGDQLMDDGQPQARPAEPACADLLGLAEGFEKMLLEFFVDTDAVIGKDQPEQPVFIPVNPQAHMARRFVRRSAREFDRVPQQVQDHLP